MKLFKTLALISLTGIATIPFSLITSCQKSRYYVTVNKYRNDGLYPSLYSQPLLFKKNNIYVATIDLTKFEDFSTKTYTRWELLICYYDEDEHEYIRQRGVNLIEKNAQLTFNGKNILLTDQSDRFTLVKDTGEPDYFCGIEATPYDKNTSIEFQFEVEKDTDENNLCVFFIPKEDTSF